MIILFGVVGVLFMTRARATPASHKEQLTAVSNLPGLTEKGTKVYRRIRERFLMDKLECKQGEREQDESTQGEHDEVEGRFLEENLYIAYGSSALRLMYSKLQTRPSFPRHWFLFFAGACYFFASGFFFLCFFSCFFHEKFAVPSCLRPGGVRA